MNVIQGQKPCHRVRMLLDSYLSNELLVETNHEILRHLEDCAECTKAMEARLQVRDLLRRAVLSIPPSQDLERRVQSSVRAAATFGEKRKPKPIPYWSLLAAGLAVAAFAALTYQVAIRDSDRLAAMFDVGWTNHKKCTLAGHYPETPPTHEAMVSQLGADFSPLLDIVDRKLPGFEIRQAHRCRIDGRRFTHITLSKAEVLMSVSIVRKRDGEAFPSHILRRLAGEAEGELQLAVRQQVQVAAFETEHYLGYVMSNQPRNENTRVAEAMEPDVRALLARL